jgi:hypothetical protein
MQTFLAGGGSDTSLEMAGFFGLVPAEFNCAVGRPRYYHDHGDLEPQGWLGGMLLKALSCEAPMTGSGRFYQPAEIAYFWSKALARADELPRKVRGLLQKGQPQPQLAKLLRSHFGKGGVFTPTGRLRAGASYCARHNTLFQGLAADGAKLALWLLWRSGYRVVAFVHDQVLIEVPEDADLAAVAEEIQMLLIEGMRLVVPDVKVDLEGGFKRRWTKAKADKVTVLAALGPVAGTSDRCTTASAA